MWRSLMSAGLLALCMSNVALAQEQAPLYSGGDGSTPEQAIVVTTTNEFEGVDAEHRWIEDHLPGARVESTSLIFVKPVIDLMEVTLPSGEKRKIYFDITSFFGKGFGGEASP